MKIRIKHGYYAKISLPDTPFQYRLIDESSGFVDVCDTTARHLVEKGAAEYDEMAPVQKQIVIHLPFDSREDGDEDDTDVPEDTSLEDLTKTQLIEIAKEAGVYKATLRSKAQLIEAIEAEDAAPVFV